MGEAMLLAAVAAALLAASPGCDGDLTGYHVKGKALRGDVDGDGGTERVTLRVDRRRPRACRHVVVAGKRSAPVRPLPWPGTAPRLLLLAEIDGRAGVEPVVTMSPANVYRPGAMFAARGGRLVRLRLARGNLFPLDDEFPTSTDCTGEPGEIEVITSLVAEDDSFWDVTRSRYRVRGRRFRRVGRERYRAPVGSAVTGESLRSCSSRAQ
jgi:hypothetical protein